MKLCYGQYDHDYIRIDLMPQRDGAMRVDVFTRTQSIDAPQRLMQPGQTATLTCAGQNCSIRYGEDKKVYLSGDLPIAPYYNGFLTAEEDGFNEYVIIE